MSEELNVAWAQHELAADPMPQIIRFFDAARAGGQGRAEPPSGQATGESRGAATLSDEE